MINNSNTQRLKVMCVGKKVRMHNIFSFQNADFIPSEQIKNF